ncbi:type i restriction-modification system, s subunit, putative (plasmid) [Mycoplasmopsis fermentans]|nr:type i restriction-modification system, s subunit, putative [Mycoplasmopsis fermentans]
MIFSIHNHYYEKIGKNIKDITEELPFEIPENWAWVRHNNIFEIIGGSQPPKSKFIEHEKQGYIRLYQIRDYGENPNPVYIPSKFAFKQSEKNDILLARYGASIGKVFFAENGAYNVALAKVKKMFINDWINKEFMFIFYKSSIYQTLVKNNSRSAQAGFNKDDLKNLFMPIPSLNESSRIVSKWNDLNKLINEYENKENQLFKLDSKIKDKLQKSILQYAIQGKLVKQDPNDEPASKLLEAIQIEKNELIKEGKIKKDKQESFIFQGEDKNYYEKIGSKVINITNEIPFEIPINWAWTRFKNIANLVLGKSPETNNINYWKNGVINWFTIADMKDKQIIEDSKKKISLQAKKEIFNNQMSKKGTLLLSFKLTIGKTSIINQDSVHNEAIVSINFYKDNNITKMFLLIFLGLLINNCEKINAIKGKTLNKEKLQKMLIPIPPIKNQNNILLITNKIIDLFKF